jgi:hypothetical protein
MGKRTTEQGLQRYRARTAQYRRLAKVANTPVVRARANDLAEAYERLGKYEKQRLDGERRLQASRKRDWELTREAHS